MKKLLIMISLMLCFSLILAGCVNESMASANVVFTRTELKKYDGKNGNLSYVAVDGLVYDVSSSPLWKGGFHNGHNAGNDLTKEIKSFSFHGILVLKIFPVVGKLIN